MKIGHVGLAMILLMNVPGYAGDVYLSPRGNDANPGTKTKPVLTLTRARDVMREAGVPGQVVLEGGTYVLHDTFELDERDSGTTYTAVAGEVVRIIGGRRIPTSAVKPVTDKAILGRIVEEAARPHLKQINLKELGLTEYGELGPRGFRRAYIPAPMELFIDGKVQNVACWPNPGKALIKIDKVIDSGSKPRNGDYGMKPGIFEYNSDRPENWTHADDLYVSGRFGAIWADDTIKVAEINTRKRTFTTTIPHLYSFEAKHFCEWYALNLLEEIDIPGEYFIDRKSGVFYFYPPEGFSDESEISVSTLDKVMVAIENAEKVRFERITFEMTRDSGIYIEGGKGNTIAGCTLRNIGGIAIQLGQGVKPFPYGRHNACGDKADGKPGEPVSRMVGSWHEHIYKFTAWNRNAGTGHRILSCDIHDIGAGGVLLGGGDRKTLTPGNNSVENCHIHHVNRWDRTYKAPVNVDGVGNKILHCVMRDCTGSAVYVHGNEHVVEYYILGRAVTACSDMGSIYLGRDASESGHSFSYNLFHDIGANSKKARTIFIDDCAYGTGRIVGNVFFRVRVGVFFNGGGNVDIRNNIFVNTKSPVSAVDKGKETAGRCKRNLHKESRYDRYFKHVEIMKPPYSTRYPWLKGLYEDDGTKVLCPLKPKGNYFGKNATDIFRDPQNMDFACKPQAASVFKKIDGFEPPPVAKIGLDVEEYRKQKQPRL